MTRPKLEYRAVRAKANGHSVSSSNKRGEAVSATFWCASHVPQRLSVGGGEYHFGRPSVIIGRKVGERTKQKDRDP